MSTTALLRRVSTGVACIAVCALVPAMQPAFADSQAAPAAKAVPAKAAKRPNVLFIMVDDLRPDLGIYGHPTAQTPNMDALGKSGLVFDNAFVSQAVCGPSRAALMTGLRPDTTGITDLNHPVSKTVPNAVTLLDAFKRAGYATYGYGKIYHHTDDDADGWTKRVPDQELIQRKEDRKNGVPNVADKAVADRASLPDTMNVDSAIADMPALAKSGKPFFMAVGIHKPHLPFVMPQADWDKYTPKRVPGPINPEGQKNAPPWALVSYEIWNYQDTKSFKPDMPKDKTAELRHAYLAAVSYADSLVGDLMAQLKKQGLDDNTIVVLWGDHGWKLGDHKAWAKHSNAEIDIHIPLMIRAPGITHANTRTKSIVETVDIYPTLAQLAGIEAPANLAGTSLEPILAKPSTAGKPFAFAQYPRNGEAGMGRLMGYTVRTDRYRYTAWVSEKDGSVVATELYDLQKDPIESVNVSGEKQYAADVKKLEAMRTAQVAATPKAPKKAAGAGNGGGKKGGAKKGGGKKGGGKNGGQKRLKTEDLYD